MRVLLACLALAACAETPPPTAKIAVPVDCTVTMPERPTWATDALPRDAGVYDKVKALLAEREQRIAYETKLEAVARSCSR